MLLFLICCVFLGVSQGAVLDPALFLSPSPPLTGEPAAQDMWSRALDLGEGKTVVEPSVDVTEPVEQGEILETDELEPPRARTFWPVQPNYGIRGIHIPLTFSLTGTYGTNTGVSTGIIGSSYASVSDGPGIFSYGKSGLAGSDYGLYRAASPGTRVYGGSGGASWSGWGNGKWGHYGKG